MGRKIVLLSDGTGNSARKLFKTNVWRLYQALDLSSAAQVAHYNDGVGTSAFRPLAIAGGAFGWGLKRNVIELYTFLCRNYNKDEGDEIHVFGFSRGAFTVRVLVRFILEVGLVQDFNSTDDLRRKARYAYRDFREKDDKGSADKPSYFVTGLARWLRDLLLRPFRPEFAKPTLVEEIKFVGVWDTVDAYGMPVEELKAGIDRYIWPLGLRDANLDARVVKACHALSIDDQRMTFHPLLWDETFAVRKWHTDEEHVTQVWFAGAHANVGGGYPDDSLSNVSLEWMIKEAKKIGLKFNPMFESEIAALAVPYGRLYDSRAGLQSYYRYGPRPVHAPVDKQDARISAPKIHESVLWRMVAGTDAYAPLALPNPLRIVSDILSIPTDEEKATARASSPRTPQNVLDLPAYQAAVLERRHHYFKHNAVLAAPRAEDVELIADTVWWRRVSYYVTLSVTAVLIVFPFIREWFPATAWEGTAVGRLWSTLAGHLADGASSVLPGFTARWIEALRAAPGTFLVLTLATVACLLWGKWLDRRIHDRALAAWNTKWRERRAQWFIASLRVRARRSVYVAAAGLLALAVIGFYLHQLFAGSCDPPGRCPVAAMTLFGVLLIADFVIAAAVVVGALWTAIVLRNMHRDRANLGSERRGFALAFANWIRTRPGAIAVRKFWSTKLAPALGALAIACLAGWLIWVAVGFVAGFFA